MLHRSMRIENERIGVGPGRGITNRVLMPLPVAQGKFVLGRGRKIVTDVTLGCGIPNFYVESAIALRILRALRLHPDRKRPAQKRVVSTFVFFRRGTLGYESFRHKLGPYVCCSLAFRDAAAAEAEGLRNRQPDIKHANPADDAAHEVID